VLAVLAVLAVLLVTLQALGEELVGESVHQFVDPSSSRARSDRSGIEYERMYEKEQNWP
jgi:hypothetical protein